jgi:hypothetical protein
MNKFTVFLCTLALIFGVMGVNSAVATTVAYDDQLAWQGAVVGGGDLEDFNSFVSFTNNTPIANWSSSGTTAIGTSFEMSEAGTDVGAAGNFIDMPPLEFDIDGTTNFRGTVQDQGGRSAARTRVVIIFPTEIYAFGADFKAIADAGAGLEFATSAYPVFSAQTVVSHKSETDGFQGFTSTDPFRVVYLQVKNYDGPGALDLGGEGFGMDNVRWSTSAPIPEPATMLLVGSGMVGLAALGRKKFFKN